MQKRCSRNFVTRRCINKILAPIPVAASPLRRRHDIFRSRAKHRSTCGHPRSPGAENEPILHHRHATRQGTARGAIERFHNRRRYQVRLDTLSFAVCEKRLVENDDPAACGRCFFAAAIRMVPPRSIGFQPCWRGKRSGLQDPLRPTEMVQYDSRHTLQVYGAPACGEYTCLLRNATSIFGRKNRVGRRCLLFPLFQNISSKRDFFPPPETHPFYAEQPGFLLREILPFLRPRFWERNRTEEKRSSWRLTRYSFFLSPRRRFASFLEKKILLRFREVAFFRGIRSSGELGFFGLRKTFWPGKATCPPWYRERIPLGKPGGFPCFRRISKRSWNGLRVLSQGYCAA